MRSKRLFKSSTDHATRDAIVQAAERLFARQGIEDTTMRQITAEAKVNLALINYHFGSKIALAYSVFDRLADDICSSRAQELSELEAAAGGVVAVEDIVRAFLRPYVEGDERHARLLIRLIQLHRFSPSDMTREISRRRFDPVARRFVTLMQRALPHLTRREVYWRFHLMLGAVLAAVSDTGPQNRLARLSNGLADASRRKELIEQVTRFVIAALGPTAPRATQAATRKKNGKHPARSPASGVAVRSVRTRHMGA